MTKADLDNIVLGQIMALTNCNDTTRPDSHRHPGKQRERERVKTDGNFKQPSTGSCIPTLQNEMTVHYSFDFAQQVKVYQHTTSSHYSYFYVVPLSIQKPTTRTHLFSYATKMWLVWNML